MASLVGSAEFQMASRVRRATGEPVQDPWSADVRLQERTDTGWRLVRRCSMLNFAGSPSAATAFLATIEKDWARRTADKTWGQTAAMLSIPAQGRDGFEIDVFLDGTQVLVSFGGLDQEFSSVPAAFRWVERALSSAYRLRMSVSGGLAREWWLEPAATGEDAPEVLASGHVSLFSFWRKDTVVYRQNRLEIAARM